MNPQSPSYTVVLTKGAHTVRAADAAAIFEAIEAGKRLVEVSVELYPGSEEVHPTTLVTAHIVHVAPVPKSPREIVAEAGVKVRGLWNARSR